MSTRTTAQTPGIIDRRFEGMLGGTKGSEQEFDEVPHWRGFQDFGLPAAANGLASLACSGTGPLDWVTGLGLLGPWATPDQWTRLRNPTTA